METTMQEREDTEARPLQAGLVAGFIGAVLLFIIQLVLQAANISGPPTGVAFADLWLGVEGVHAIAIGLLLFALAGAAWGGFFAFVVKPISIASGAAFGILPWLAVMLVLYPFMDKPLFAGGEPMGIIMPLILNVLWGAFMGAVVPALPFKDQVWLNDRS